MKFGEYLRTNKVADWQHFYLDYDKLKGMIKELEAIHLAAPADHSGTATSLSVPRPTNAAGMPVEGPHVTQEQFYAFLEQEMRKIEQFTKKQVNDIRRVLAEVEGQITLSGSDLLGKKPSNAEELRVQVEKAGEEFLRLEKYVNLNFTGFHKILKKHDRRLPNPCRAFYAARLHDQSWVRGDYSDVIVSMSRVYSKLRGDEEVEEKENAKQDFVRSTRKYWVHTEDISAIKYYILQHLPVFLQKTMAGETDSQLVNSVYLDNYSMELYRGRLEKTPGAIALRFRWYGTGTPDVVFVERKTHRDSWTGEVSVKERFTIREDQVQSLLQGNFDVEGEIQRLRKKGKSEEDIRDWRELVTEVIQAINSKQLVPTVRTQYMRTAFQIPFDATVRISMDTNLCMILERTKDTMNGSRWFRDPSQAVPLEEITRFPHSVLEVKLQLEDETKTPQWVVDMLHSGKLLEVHKFSKFIHGCAVLMPDDVRAVPYWIDDATLADSICRSGAQKLLETSTGANEHYQHLLPHDTSGKIKEVPKPRRIQPSTDDLTQSVLGGDGLIASGAAPQQGDVSEPWYTREYCNDDWCDENCCDWGSSAAANHMTVQKVEPKLFLANERTFISWLHMAVMLSSISVGVLAFSNTQSNAQDLALTMLPISLLFIFYALRTYLIRGTKIRTRDAERWDDPLGPVLLTLMLVFALSVQFIMKIRDIWIAKERELQ
eukprot:scaffold6470_cov243-Ochromonas_danica.AAC.2